MSYRQCTGEVFGWIAYELTWCDNGIQSEAADAGSGCFSSCCKISDWQLLAACLCCCLLGSQQMSEEFVHNTRCANISEALTVGIGLFSLQWLDWTGRHYSHVGAQAVRSLSRVDISLGCTALAWEMSEGTHGKLVGALSGLAAQALTASLSMTLGPKGSCIGMTFIVIAKGSGRQL